MNIKPIINRAGRMQPVDKLGFIGQISIPEDTAYRLSKTGHGSDWYGPCEVCGKHADSTYLLTKFSVFEHEGQRRTANRGGTFGHKKCLSELTAYHITTPTDTPAA